MVPSSAPVILFDGVCTLCNRAVQFVIARDPAGRFRFASLASAAGAALLRQAGLPAAHRDSLVLVEGGRAYVRSEAALRIARHLRGWRWAGTLRAVPRPLRDAVYGFVARHRYRVFGKEDACPVPTPALRARLLPGGVGPEAAVERLPA
ncbi:MAG: thiol-disulfide oxidoreductase DCC family protein [Rubricoccaceae bacterium]